MPPPRLALPAAPDIDDDIDIAQTRGNSMQAMGRGPVLATPQAPARATALAASPRGKLFDEDEDDLPVSKTRR